MPEIAYSLASVQSDSQTMTMVRIVGSKYIILRLFEPTCADFAAVRSVKIPLRACSFVSHPLGREHDAWGKFQ
jgi:Ca2+/Na+ antiporter